MIRFGNIMKLLADNGYTSYRLRKEKLLSEGTMTRLREGCQINTTTIDTICRLCNCQPGDFLQYIPDTEKKEQD
jgi:putative transcriptional regulator